MENITEKDVEKLVSIKEKAEDLFWKSNCLLSRDGEYFKIYVPIEVWVKFKQSIIS